MAVSTAGFGQNSKWQLSIQVQPELTLHKDNYSWVKTGSDKTTFNVGLASTIQYNINNRFFVSSGTSFISRTLRTANFLSQSSLPPPKQSFTRELVITRSVSYRVISVPVNIGYNFVATDKFKSYITAGFSGNYLLNTKYFSKASYDGTYKKYYWQGYSLIAGLGADFKLSSRIDATTSLSYALKYRVKEDEYLQNQNDNGLTLEHNYLALSMGIKLAL